MEDEEEELLLNQMEEEEEEESSFTNSTKHNETQAKMSMKSILKPPSNTLQKSALMPPPINQGSGQIFSVSGI